MSSGVTAGGLTGVIAEWDDPRGVGEVRSDDGRTFVLQCTNIADGSRTATVGDRVRFTTGPGHHGRTQALDVQPA